MWRHFPGRSPHSGEAIAGVLLISSLHLLIVCTFLLAKLIPPHRDAYLYCNLHLLLAATLARLGFEAKWGRWSLTAYYFT